MTDRQRYKRQPWQRTRCPYTNSGACAGKSEETCVCVRPTFEATAPVPVYVLLSREDLDLFKEDRVLYGRCILQVGQDGMGERISPHDVVFRRASRADERDDDIEAI